MSLDIKAFLPAFFSGPEGLTGTLSGYEPRPDQQAMAEQVWEAFDQEIVALFEAGTGIGKSMAYLVPAILWSLETGEKVVISTHTIALQEQLIEKDIPTLLPLLGVELRFALAKGMGNYLCLRKLEENRGGSDPSAGLLLSWTTKTVDGTRSTLPFSISKEGWTKVSADGESCSYAKCPHYKKCFFFKARSKLETADLIIINHHMLMAHLLAPKGKAPLPPFSRIIIDEAHHLESVTADSLTQTLDRTGLISLLSKFETDREGNEGHLTRLKGDAEALYNREKLQESLSHGKRELVTQIHQAFDLLDGWMETARSAEKWRLKDPLISSPFWRGTLVPILNSFKEAMASYSTSLATAARQLQDQIDGREDDSISDAVGLLQTLSDQLSEGENLLNQLTTYPFGEGQVAWVEKGQTGTILSLAQLDISLFLRQKLFDSVKTAVLCSATLAVKGEFPYIKRHLGIERKTIEGSFPSPFDFQNRTQLLGISDLPSPAHPTFISAAASAIREAIEASKGGAFVLFTSYEMLHKCALALNDLPILKQGNSSRHLLLETFKKQAGSILFGTDSFWEGVDVPGDALRLVIIAKLPFPVPTDPLFEARTDALRESGIDPFLKEAVPLAIMKFKQGFGRLMRRKEDRGCILVLDKRIFTESYGKLFLESLPECITFYGTQKLAINEMKKFYRNRG